MRPHLSISPPARRCCRCRCSRRRSATSSRCRASACRCSRSATARSRSRRSSSGAEADVRALAGIPGQLPGAVPAGRREPAVLDGADEPAPAGRDGRLHRDRRLGEEGDQGGEEGRRGQRGRRRPKADNFNRIPAQDELPLTPGARLRPHDVEQHDLRHASGTTCQTSATCRWSATPRRTSSRRPIDVSRYGLIYAGAQKNLGPSGVTAGDRARRPARAVAPTRCRRCCNYATHAGERSLYNTPPAFGIYILRLVLKWLGPTAGSAAIQRSQRAQGRSCCTPRSTARAFCAAARANRTAARG